jgi:hypothetical protein
MQHTHQWFPQIKTTQAPPVHLAPPVSVNQTRHLAPEDEQTPVYSNADYEIYQVSELRAKYFLHQRVELNAFIPLNSFHFYSQGTATHFTGMGDMTLYAGYHLIRKIETEGLQQRLIIGAGAKLPTGNYRIESTGTRLPLLMQCGTGSVDGFFMANYIAGFNRFGLSLTAMAKFNGRNAYKEQVLPSTTQTLNLFYKIKKGSWFFIPSVQNYYEFTQGMLSDGHYEEGTGMNILYTGLGFDVFYKNFGLTTSVQGKTWEQKTDGKIAGTSRVAIGLTWNFNQRNYLLK